MSGGDRELVKPLPAITKLPPHDKTELQKILLETPKKSWYHIFRHLSRDTKNGKTQYRLKEKNFRIVAKFSKLLRAMTACWG